MTKSEHEAPTSSKGSFKGGKLRGAANYTIWIFQMQAYLKGHDLWAPVTDMASQADETTHNRTFIELVGSLTDEMVFTVIDKTTAKEVWDPFQNTCRVSAAANRVFLAQDFRTRKYSSKAGMQQYLNTMKDLKMRLTNAAQEITEDDLVTTVLTGVYDKEYTGVVNALTI